MWMGGEGAEMVAGARGGTTSEEEWALPASAVVLRRPAAACRGVDGRGRPGYAQMAARGGQMRLAVVVGEVGGRWAAEVAHARAGRRLQKMLAGRGVEAHESLRGDMALGLAVVAGWRGVSDVAGSEDAWALMDAYVGLNRRHDVKGFLEHRMLESCAFEHGVRLPQDWRYMTAEATARAVLAAAVDGNCLVRVADVTGARTLGDVMEDWRRRWPEAAGGDGVLWRVCPVLASAMVNGRWAADVSAWSVRDVAHGMAPCVPVLGVLRAMESSGQAAIVPQCPRAEGQGEEVAVWASRKGAVRRYHPEHLIASLRVSRDVASGRNTKRCMKASLQWFYPKSWKRLLRPGGTERREDDAVSHWTLSRGVVRLDAACMLWNREQWRVTGPVVRYLSFDASPQHGQEIFASVERLVSRADLRGVGPGGLPEVRCRGMPLCVLGTGRQGLAEKTQAHLHQTWLEYGPKMADVRRACAAVVTVLTDLGVEAGVVDALDVVEESLVLGCPASAEAPVENAGGGVRYLFPRAFGVPGPQHAIDGTLHEAIQAQPWWTGFQVRLKAVAQYVRVVAHRRRLRALLTAAEEAAFGDLLAAGCDRFAVWRWQTLHLVTRRLLKMQPAVRAAVTRAEPGVQYTSRGGELGAFMAAAGDDVFWERMSWLYQVVEVLHRLSSWIKGCHCHEAERKLGKSVVCQWAGCRAQGLAARVRETMGELRALRERLMSEVEEWGDAVVNRVMHTLQLKMAWLEHGPALVWQVCTPAAALRLLEERDGLVAAGETPHRVTELFAGPGTQMRLDMRRYADGGGLSDELRTELLAYGAAKIDDTWSEAVHREVSGLARKHTAAKLPYLAACWRMEQNVSLWDGLTEVEQRRLGDLMLRTGQLGRQRRWKSRRVERRPTRKRRSGGVSLDAFVYRYDDAALRDWEEAMGGATLRLLATEPAARRRETRRVQREYLSKVLQAGRVYSLPGCAVDQGGAGAQAAEFAFFQLVHARAGRQKTGVTDVGGVRGRMVSMQRLLAWPREEEGAAVEGEHLLSYDGDPEMLDPLQWCADWRQWTTGLKVWSQVRSGVGGRMAVMTGETVEAVTDWKDDAVTTWMLMKQLAATGWRRIAPAPSIHHLDSEKALGRSKDPVEKRQYLRCLLGLSQLLTTEFRGLPSGQMALYYECVLRAPEAQLVPVGAKEGDYRKLKKAIEQGEFSAAVQLLRRPGGAVEEAAGVESDDSAVPMGCVVAARSVLKRPAARATARTGHGLAAGDCAAESDEDWLAMLPEWKDVEALPLHDEAIAPVPVAPLEVADTGGASSSNAAAQVEAEVEVVAGSHSRVRHETRLLEGVVARISTWPGLHSYSRVIVKCPWHAKCEAQRSFSHDFAMETGCGGEEPFCLLGVWLRRGKGLVNAQVHKDLKATISVEERRDYAREHGWPLVPPVPKAKARPRKKQRKTD